MNNELLDAMELLVEATELIVHIPENQKYLDAAATVESYLATYEPKEE